MNDFNRLIKDPELNLALAETQFPKNGWEIYKDDPEYPKILWVRYKDFDTFKQINYLKNWNDLMPLVVKYEVTLYKYMSCTGWQAFLRTLCNIEIYVNNNNPQRALTECILKVLTESKEK